MQAHTMTVLKQNSKHVINGAISMQVAYKYSVGRG